jgi:hypothetical protein
MVRRLRYVRSSYHHQRRRDAEEQGFITADRGIGRSRDDVRNVRFCGISSSRGDARRWLLAFILARILGIPRFFGTSRRIFGIPRVFGIPQFFGIPRFFGISRRVFGIPQFFGISRRFFELPQFFGFSRRVFRIRRLFGIEIRLPRQFRSPFWGSLHAGAPIRLARALELRA